MHHIIAPNVNVALAKGLMHLKSCGEVETSRNGTVVVSPCPVTTTYIDSTQRVLFSPTRDANPFFHFMESLWMLAGRNDLAFPVQFNRNFASYSDDGENVHGAYGHRWRNWFGYDQLELIADDLIKNPASRRSVLAMWDASGQNSPDHAGPWDGNSDLSVAAQGGKDVPCNTHAYFDCRHGKLNMTVCCRSNDIYWGAYGANAVHFSVLLELMAAWIGVPVGLYRQMSNNFHAYTDIVPLDKFEALAQESVESNLYAIAAMPEETTPLVTTSVGNFFNELSRFMSEPLDFEHFNYQERIFPDVAVPMYRAWITRKTKGNDAGIEEAANIRSWDWRMACIAWIERRAAKKGATL